MNTRIRFSFRARFARPVLTERDEIVKKATEKSAERLQLTSAEA
jgi:hypothetical protein